MVKTEIIEEIKAKINGAYLDKHLDELKFELEKANEYLDKKFVASYDLTNERLDQL